MFSIEVFTEDSPEIIIPAWVNVLLEYWKQKEVYLAMRWGMCEFEDKETERPEFRGVIIQSYIDGSDMKFYPENKAAKKRFKARAAILGMLMFVVGCVCSIVAFKIFLNKVSEWGQKYGPFIASFANGVLVEAFSILVASNLALYLANYENHRTDTEYEDSLILKMFVFEVTSSYSQLYYIAFLAQSTSTKSGVHTAAVTEAV